MLQLLIPSFMGILYQHLTSSSSRSFSRRITVAAAPPLTSTVSRMRKNVTTSST